MLESHQTQQQLSLGMWLTTMYIINYTRDILIAKLWQYPRRRSEIHGIFCPKYHQNYPKRDIPNPKLSTVSFVMFASFSVLSDVIICLDLVFEPCVMPPGCYVGKTIDCVLTHYFTQFGIKLTFVQNVGFTARHDPGCGIQTRSETQNGV